MNLKRLGVEPSSVIVHSDRDSVFTGYRWLWHILIAPGASVSHSERGARHNPWIESCWSRLKLEWASRLIEAANLDALDARGPLPAPS